MHIVSPTQLEVSGSRFESNLASVGGAIYILDGNEAYAFFSACVFKSNEATDGGAFYSQRGPGMDIFSTSLFLSNFARESLIVTMLNRGFNEGEIFSCLRYTFSFYTFHVLTKLGLKYKFVVGRTFAFGGGRLSDIALKMGWKC